MQGRVVLVTGAARGIGKEVARQLADLGASVLVSARKVDDARAAAKDLSAVGDVRALEVDLDVADDTSVQAAAKALGRDPSRLDVLVNNAAAYVDWSETASSADLAAAHQMLEVNLHGPWRLPMPCCRCCDEATSPSPVHALFTVTVRPSPGPPQPAARR
jgi:NAD(P)-dependent dehydrogenase (short-subunit alcohol dehydrogenase family)